MEEEADVAVGEVEVVAAANGTTEGTLFFLTLRQLHTVSAFHTPSNLLSIEEIQISFVPRTEAQ